MKYPAKRILLIAIRQIGDVLLNTPLIRSLRRAYPDADIDVLIYQGTGGVLEGNPDISNVIEIEEHPRLPVYLATVRKLFRRYDLALTTQGTDRAWIYALWSSARRIGIVRDLTKQNAWKRMVASAWTELDDRDTHTVVQNLMLCDLIGIQKSAQVVTPSSPTAAEALDGLLPFQWRDNAYVVIHACAKWRYKYWTVEGWLEAARFCQDQGLQIVLTGGPDRKETALVAELAGMLGDKVTDISGRASFAELATLIHGARLYIGPDTALTHLAAATGVATIAIFGPTNPVKWAPWPSDGNVSGPSPWQRRATLQHSGNVALLQNTNEACMPCHGEGCERHRQSFSRCLDTLPGSQVTDCIAALLT